jgi:hypothetical protein
MDYTKIILLFLVIAGYIIVLQATGVFGIIIPDPDPNTDRVFLNDFEELTFLWPMKYTNRQRYEARQQIMCVGEFCHELKAYPQKITCKITPHRIPYMLYPEGYFEKNTKVTCTGDLDKRFEFKSTELECEGFYDDDDPYILRGSCAVIFELKKAAVDPDVTKHMTAFGLIILIVLSMFWYCELPLNTYTTDRRIYVFRYFMCAFTVISTISCIVITINTYNADESHRFMSKTWYNGIMVLSFALGLAVMSFLSYLLENTIISFFQSNQLQQQPPPRNRAPDPTQPKPTPKTPTMPENEMPNQPLPSTTQFVPSRDEIKKAHEALEREKAIDDYLQYMSGQPSSPIGLATTRRTPGTPSVRNIWSSQQKLPPKQTVSVHCVPALNLVVSQQEIEHLSSSSTAEGEVKRLRKKKDVVEHLASLNDGKLAPIPQSTQSSTAEGSVKHITSDPRATPWKKPSTGQGGVRRIQPIRKEE